LARTSDRAVLELHLLGGREIVNGLSLYPAEGEIILAPGSKFCVQQGFEERHVPVEGQMEVLQVATLFEIIDDAVAMS
jgi:hypothetical protein